MNPVRRLASFTAALAIGAGALAVSPAQAAETDQTDGTDVPVTVSLPSATREVVVSDAAITAPARTVPIRPGDTLAGYWAGVKPAGTWTVWLMPGDRALGATSVGESGRAEFSVVLPADLAVGDYRLELAQPIRPGGGPRTSLQYLVRPALPFTVVAAAARPPASGTATGGTPGRSTSTGTGAVPPVSAPAGAVPGVVAAGAPAAASLFLSVSGLATRYAGAVNPFAGTATVELSIANNGSEPVAGEVTAWVTDALGRTVGTKTSTRLTELAPQTAQTVTISVPDVGQAGMLTARATVTPDIPADASEQKKAQLAPVTREAVFWALPLLPLGIAAVLTAIGLALFFLRRRAAVLLPAQGAAA